MNKTYWNDKLPPIQSKAETPKNCSILIIGSGITGSSVAYHLSKFETDVSIVDCGSENAAYYRNAGHILHGACENYKAMSSVHGREKTKKIFSLSEKFCYDMKNTIVSEEIECDYFQGQYLFVGKDQKETSELEQSVSLMNEDGFKDTYLISDLEKFKIKGSLAKVCDLSAQANPAKFRDALMQKAQSKGVEFYSKKIVNVDPQSDRVVVTYVDQTKSTHDAVVIAANAYAPLFSEFFASRKLIDPFRGQIIVSKPLPVEVPRYQFSMDHGYIYGTITTSKRLLIGGWRNNVPGGEVGTYSLDINPAVEQGLKEHVKNNFDLPELEWEYGWSGIMGSSSTGLPFIGPTNSPLVFTCSGCTGYGFGWFHGGAKLLVDIMYGNSLPEGYELLNPVK
jgi:glycine/D-amino acid oxidase-like deaminating enzyme